VEEDGPLVPPEAEAPLEKGQAIYNVPKAVIEGSSRHDSGASSSEGPLPGRFNIGRRDSVLHHLAAARAHIPPPKVAISYRPGFGYDSGTFSKGRTKVSSTSAPPGFEPVPVGESAEPQEEEARQSRVHHVTAREDHLRRLSAHENGTGSDAPGADPIDEHLQSVQGVFIPGGQDRPVSSDERDSRATYEQHLIRIARNRGIPTLAVCGGSRCLATGFGGREQELSEEERAVHNPSGGLNKKAHPIHFTSPSTILGGAAPFNRDPSTGRTDTDTRSGRFPSAFRDRSLQLTPPSDRESLLDSINSVNSTHVKVAAHGAGGAIESNTLPTGESELITSALSADATPHPEGFETRHGAPIVGVTSHPEAIAGASSTARKAATPQAQEFSDNVFRHFAGAMQTYGLKQLVNQQIRARGEDDRH
jgi:gamma-glutamyl-gamma-aminobutyrate hydrolase PuuD